MTVAATRITCSTSAVLLAQAGLTPMQVTIRNTDGANGMNVGTVTVAAGTGFPMAAGVQVTVLLTGGDAIYGIRSGAADVVAVVLMQTI